MSYRSTAFFLIFTLLLCKVESVAKFEIFEVSSNSIIVRMTHAANVTRYEMAVTIYDLDNLMVYRHSESSSNRLDNQVETRERSIRTQ